MGKNIQLHRWHIPDVAIRAGEAVSLSANSVGAIQTRMGALEGKEPSLPLRIELAGKEPLSVALLDTLDRQAAHRNWTGMMRVQRGSGETGKPVIVRLHDERGPHWGIEPKDNGWKKSLPMVAEILLADIALANRLRSERLVIGMPHDGAKISKGMALGAQAMMARFAEEDFTHVELRPLLGAGAPLAQLQGNSILLDAGIRAQLPTIIDRQALDTTQWTSITHDTPVGRAISMIDLNDSQAIDALAERVDQQFRTAVNQRWDAHAQPQILEINSLSVFTPSILNQSPRLQHLRWSGLIRMTATNQILEYWYNTDAQLVRSDVHTDYCTMGRVLTFNAQRLRAGAPVVITAPQLAYFVSGERHPGPTIESGMRALREFKEQLPHVTVFWKDRVYDLHERDVRLA